VKQTNSITYQFLFSILLVIAIISCSATPKQSYKEKENIYLDSLEMLFTNVPQWLTTLYDSTSGGFYHNALMADDPRFEPDMQSTAFVLNILLDGNIIDSVPASYRNKLKTYVFSRYDSSRGLFLDSLYAERILQSDRTLGRSQTMVTLITDKLGIKEMESPLIQENTPEYLKSLDHFKSWVQTRKWERVWSSFDHISSQCAFIKRLPPEQADSLIRFVQDYALLIQNEDGLWGKGQAQEVRISGALKYALFCERMGIPMPGADKIYKTVLEWLRTNEELDFSEHSPCPICVPRNALTLLAFIKPGLSFPIPVEDRLVLVKNAYVMLKFYHNRDGGFMKNHLESRIVPLDIDYGKYDSLVSDLNGTMMAFIARRDLYKLLELPIPPIEMTDRLKKILMSDI